MAWTNFMITIVGVGSIYYLMRRDVRQGAAQLRRNAKTIKGWIEEAEASSSKGSEGTTKPPSSTPGGGGAGGEAAPKPPSSSTPNKAE